MKCRCQPLTSMPSATEVVAVSWRHEAEDTWGTGADSLAELGERLTRTHWKDRTCLQDPSFEIRTWVRSPASEPAAAATAEHLSP